ncbi:MAG: Eco57I restriction-modification methylase domain-containing protein, partial [Desulfobacteraceae bacterium]|nr:Eco57I restriction-modification methylase domain-containing protein [Desulfobacteraceae bacterium]
DLYAYFIEKGVSLLKPDGWFAYIVANKWLRANYGKPLRRWMKQRHISEIVDFGDLPVFSQASTYPCILVLRNKAPGNTFSAATLKRLNFQDLPAHVRESAYEVRQHALDDAGWSLVDQHSQDLLDKIRQTGTPLGEYVQGKIYRGVLTGLNEAFVIDGQTREQLIAEDPKSAEIIKPFLAGRDIKRYKPLSSDKYLIFTRRGIDIDQYKAVKNYLNQFTKRLKPRPKDWKGEKWPGRKPGAYKWYEIQDTIDYYEEFEKPKIMLPDISLRGNFAMDEAGGKYCVNTAYIIASSEPYLLGILNSSLITFFYKNIASTYRGGYLRFIYQYLMVLPVPVINFSNTSEKARHDQMVALVDQMLTLNRQLEQTRTAHEKKMLERQIQAVDKRIDQLAYQLYNLTDDEIRIIESGA